MENNTFNISENLDNISNFINDLKEKFEARNKVVSSMIDILDEIFALGDGYYFLQNKEYVFKMKNWLDGITDLLNKDNPTIEQQLDALMKMLQILKAGVKLAKNENAEIV